MTLLHPWFRFQIAKVTPNQRPVATPVRADASDNVQSPESEVTDTLVVVTPRAHGPSDTSAPTTPVSDVAATPTPSAPTKAAAAYRPKGMTLRQACGYKPKSVFSCLLMVWYIFLLNISQSLKVPQHDIIHSSQSGSSACLPLQFQLRRAAKARLDRMVQPKSKRRELEAPQWLKDEWKNGDKAAIADLLRTCNWDKELSYVNNLQDTIHILILLRGTAIQYK